MAELQDAKHGTGSAGLFGTRVDGARCLGGKFQEKIPCAAMQSGVNP